MVEEAREHDIEVRDEQGELLDHEPRDLVVLPVVIVVYLDGLVEFVEVCEVLALLDFLLVLLPPPFHLLFVELFVLFALHVLVVVLVAIEEDIAIQDLVNVHLLGRVHHLEMLLPLLGISLEVLLLSLLLPIPEETIAHFLVIIIVLLVVLIEEVLMLVEQLVLLSYRLLVLDGGLWCHLE